MEKELMEMLEKLNKVMEKEIKKFEKSGGVKKQINDAFKEKCTISITKEANGKSITTIDGSNLAILITLAGLEQSVLEKLDPPAGLYEDIKKIVGIREAEDNE